MGKRAVTKKPKVSLDAKRLMLKSAEQLVRQLAPQVHGAYNVAKAGYGLYKATKRPAAQSKPSKKKVVEKQLETQIAGGHGITLHRKVIGTRLTKLPPSVRMQKEAIRNAREIYDQGVALTVVNQQKFATLHTVMDYNDFNAIMGTGTPESSRKLFIEAYVTTFEFNNVTNTPCELTFFQHVATDPALDTQSPEARFKQGMDRKFGDAANVELKMFHGPHESPTLLKFYKSNYAKKVILSPGECVQYKVYNNVNKTMKNDAFQGNSNTNFTFYADGWTAAHSIMLRGFTVFEAVPSEAGRGVYAPVKVAWTAHKRIIFRTWDSGAPATSVYSTNDLVPVTGTLQEVNQELGAGQTIVNL